MRRNPIRNHLILWGWLILGIVGVMWPGTAWAQEGPVGAAYRGERIYAQRCTQCHGIAGKGDGPMADQVPVTMPDFTDPTYVEERTPQQVFDIITNGNMENLMPPWGDALSEQQRWDLVAHVWSLSLQPEEIAATVDIYEGACADCHGADGEGSDYDPPLNPLSDLIWLDRSESDLRAAFSNPPHPPLDDLSESDLKLAAVAARDFSLGVTMETAIVEGNGVIEVVIRNGTSNEIVSDQAMRLLLFEGDTFVTERTANTDDEGRARFVDMPTDATWVYLTEVMYDDLPYGGEVRQFEPSSELLEMEVNVYERGANVDDIHIGRAHWVLSLDNANALDVGELYALTNDANRVYAGEEGSDGINRVLRFDLPPGARDVSVEGDDLGERFILEDGAIIDTLPLAPGSRQVLFRYNLPVNDGEVNLFHPIGYPIDNLNLLVPDVGMEIDASQWTEGELLQAQGGAAYRNFTITSIPAGTTTGAAFSNIEPAMVMPPASQSDSSGQIIDANATPGISGLPALPLLVFAGSIGLLAVGMILVIRRQRMEEVRAPQRRELQRHELIQQIADLDDDFDNGEISTSDYEAQRRLLKAQLVALMREDA